MPEYIRDFLMEIVRQFAKDNDGVPSVEPVEGEASFIMRDEDGESFHVSVTTIDA